MNTKIGKTLYYAFGIFIVIVVIQAYCIYFEVPSYVFPRPTYVIGAIKDVFSDAKVDFLITLYEALLGFFLSVVFSLGVTYLMDRFKVIDQILYPIFVAMQSIPTLILAPIFAIWFGFGTLPKIIVIVMVCFFPIVVNLLQGFKAIDPDYLKLMKIYKATYNQTFYHVKFKGSLKAFFGGLKVSISYSFIGAIFAEMMGGQYGVGLVLMRYKSGYQVDNVFAVIILTMIISFSLFKLLELLERRFDKNEEKVI